MPQNPNEHLEAGATHTFQTVDGNPSIPLFLDNELQRHFISTVQAPWLSHSLIS